MFPLIYYFLKIHSFTGRTNFSQKPSITSIQTFSIDVMALFVFKTLTTDSSAVLSKPSTSTLYRRTQYSLYLDLLSGLVSILKSVQVCSITTSALNISFCLKSWITHTRVRWNKKKMGSQFNFWGRVSQIYTPFAVQKAK